MKIRSYLETRREVTVARPRIIAEVQARRVTVMQNVLQRISGQLQHAEQRIINCVYSHLCGGLLNRDTADC